MGPIKNPNREKATFHNKTLLEGLSSDEYSDLILAKEGYWKTAN